MSLSLPHCLRALLLFAVSAAGVGCGSTPAPAVADAANSASDGASVDAAKPVPLADKYALSAKFPEGGIFDPGAQAFYVGSLADGSVHRIDAATGVDSVLFSETAAGTWWSLGMDVDLERRRLWVCAMDDRKPGPRAGSVWIFDLNTGKRIANHALASAAGDATCTDVAVAKTGVGYVVDRELPNVYEVDILSGPKLFATGPELKGTFAGQNAIVVLPDASALLSVVYDSPKLVRIDLLDKSVKAVAIDGTFADDSLLAGADGMVYADGGVYVAFTSKLVRVAPKSADWAAATATAAAVTEGVTDVVNTPDGLYLLNGQAVRFALGQPTDPFALVRFAGKF